LIVTRPPKLDAMIIVYCVGKDERNRMCEKYRPSSGTEGCQFETEFCDHCKADKPYGTCEIMTNSMCYAVDDPKYPKQWIYKDGKPTCTAFDPVDGCDKKRTDLFSGDLLGKEKNELRKSKFGVDPGQTVYLPM